MKRTEEPPVPVPEKRKRDVLFVGGTTLFLVAGTFAAAVWTISRPADNASDYDKHLLVAGAIAAGGLVLAVARLAILGPSRILGLVTAEVDILGGRAWERRNPWFPRLLGLVVPVSGLVAIPFLAARAEPDRFELARGAALCFLTLGGIAVESICRAAPMRTLFPSAWARAVASLAVLALLAGASVAYFRGFGLAAPWLGPWGRNIAWAIAEISLIIGLAVLAWLSGGRSSDTPREPRA